MTDMETCLCGSGQIAEPLYDGYGIYMTMVCPKCRAKKVAGFRPDIFERYEADEPIEEDSMRRQLIEIETGEILATFDIPHIFTLWEQVVVVVCDAVKVLPYNVDLVQTKTGPVVTVKGFPYAEFKEEV